MKAPGSANSGVVLSAASGSACKAVAIATPISVRANKAAACRAVGHGNHHQYTAQPIEAIERKLERDSYMSAEEARDFGLVDEVVENRPVPTDDAAKAT